MAVAGCTPTSRTGDRPEWLTRCHVDGFDVETLCGTLTVPEDPSNPDSSRSLELRVVVVPAVRPVPDPDPLVLLAGGPGQAATEAYGPLMRALSRIQQRRDLVMMDQRGTGASAPLDCPSVGEDTLAERFAVDVPMDEITDCRDALTEGGATLSHYTTASHTADLEALRTALGVTSWNLYGGSYGTRAALDYAETHPERVRRLILDGVAPRQMPLFGTFAEDGQAALDALVAACAADVSGDPDKPGCAEAFPELSERLDRFLAADDHPLDLIHPRTGAPEAVGLPGSVRAAALRNILYSPHIAALVPQAVYSATPPLPAADASTESPPPAGDLQPFIALAGAVGGDALSDSMSLGLMLSVACSEDVHRIEDAHVERSRDAFLGDQLIDVARQWCAEWPVEPVLQSPVSGVSWDGPVLLMSGQLDPVTPPRWAETAAETLPDHAHIIVPGGGHIVAASGCVPEKMAEFLTAEASVATMLDVSCAENTVRPPFALDFAGPRG